MLPTPQIAHLSAEDYEHVYEPAEDSFILLDALESDLTELVAAAPSLCVEVGSGSGVVSAFIATILNQSSLFLCTDINPWACSATKRTAKANNVNCVVVLDVIQTDLLSPLERRGKGCIDLLVFNPPYVPTDINEASIGDISAAWAGGHDGMLTTERLILKLPNLLAPGGRFYLVAVQQNQPNEILALMRRLGLEANIHLRRRAGGEVLFVIKCYKPNASI
ncbi:S-adenosyl-L-methionine-dependent methyltransferase [Naematelia encephala]|uniref:S-adenosyl-L-methionine-dependent methyltransferase n=1 Tax=Naematelia encephala TaxID=71784 RepID=A0A1Y2AKF4_9TREE|nr:S-adenosyl-L-methionine-dependent methyltransferase [Naematelia encephala]